MEVAALVPALQGRSGSNAGDNDDTTRDLSGRSVRVLACRRRARRYGGTSWLGLRDLSKPDDPPSSRLWRDRQHGNTERGKPCVSPVGLSACHDGQNGIAFESSLMHTKPMSDKELALDSIRQLPADAKLDTIAERSEFLAAMRKGFDQIERGEIVPHEEVKRQSAAWLSK